MFWITRCEPVKWFACFCCSTRILDRECMCMRRLFDIMNGLDCRDAIAEPYRDVFTDVLNNDEYLWNTNIIHDDNYSYSNTKHAHNCLLKTPWILPCRLGVGVLPPTLLQPIYFAYSTFEWTFAVVIVVKSPHLMTGSYEYLLCLQKQSHEYY